MSLAEERPRAGVRARDRAQAIATRVHVDTAAPAAVPSYQGLVTRTIAFALDCAVITLVAITVGLAVGLASSVLGLPSEVDRGLVAIGGLTWFLWSAGYFVVCWSTTGQTPGDRLFHIRVRKADEDRPLSAWRSFLRLIYLTLAAIPLFAGFLPILFDDRRRGLHDMLAGSVVVGTDPA